MVHSQQMGVHCGHPHEHGGLASGEAAPNMWGVERSELHCCGRVVRAQEAVNEAMDVVEWQGVQQSVVCLPLPCMCQALHL